MHNYMNRDQNPALNKFQDNPKSGPGPGAADDITDHAAHEISIPNKLRKDYNFLLNFNMQCCLFVPRVSVIRRYNFRKLEYVKNSIYFGDNFCSDIV